MNKSAGTSLRGHILPCHIANTRDAEWNETSWTLLVKTRKRLLRCIRAGGKTWDLLKTLWIDL
jgi:hypothetical protein